MHKAYLNGIAANKRKKMHPRLYFLRSFLGQAGSVGIFSTGPFCISAANELRRKGAKHEDIAKLCF